ncbi:MAG TPA: glycosyltransferase [Ignavibacteria bacterium]|nr:glycosyltransferase [Ignavibacteria bacterium]HMQ97687.1 glycosyltransferase [Ignavibacteria bacterium]
MLISIIIVNHNTGSILNDCINSIIKLETGSAIEIIIVDNYSTDDSKQVISDLAGKCSNIKYEFSDALISFSEANNIGIRLASGDYILIMNPDIIFTEPVMDKLIADMKSNEDIGAITPALIGTDGNFQRNYFQRYPSIRQFIYYHSIIAKFFNLSAKRMNKYLENQDIDMSTGRIYFTEQIPCAFFLTMKTTIEKLGLMDESYKLFFEDVDLSYKMAKNKKLAVDTGIKVTHLGGSSFKTDNNWWLHGRYIMSMINFFKKHYSPVRTTLLKVLVKLNSYLILIIEALKNIFGRKDEYRQNKHRYLIQLLKEEN